MSLAVVLFVCAGTAVADTVAVGDPVVFGSWQQGFHAFNMTFDSFGIVMLSGTLESPGTNGFSNGSWGANFVFPWYATATGNTLTDLTFSALFSGSPNDPLSFTIYFYDAGALIETDTASWHPAIGWDIQEGGAQVPEPGSLALFGSGLTAIAFRIRKRWAA
ncbi:MAG: PEP-CTERM sorting domain-containing protein [Acidobacteriia bacterium]|nr:PEP-CTERM sorting domain-containing protein [Terriglobia bacterium]